MRCKNLTFDAGWRAFIKAKISLKTAGMDMGPQRKVAADAVHRRL
jgi:hypothetical protein